MHDVDAIVVGSGPNGLAAAITLARAGRSVRVLEAEPTPGGGCRSAELTLPGVTHDVCSTVQALAAASPFFQSVPLERLGVELVHPQAPLAHPLDDGTAAVLERSVEDTAAGLGRDGGAYRRLLQPLVDGVDGLLEEILGPARLPRHPVTLARFGPPALLPATALARLAFRGDHAQALLGGVSAHATLPLTAPLTSAFGLVLQSVAHAYGWPVARGGSQALTDGLVAYLRELGGELVTGHRVSSMDELEARAVLFDLTPRQILSIAGDDLPPGYRRRLERYRYGPGVFKLDWALSRPIPWRAEGCHRAGTVHLGGPLPELVASEAALGTGTPAERPFTLVVQATRFDPTRAPLGTHTAWAYCHVPNGCEVDMTERIEAQVERFAPGFRDLVLARSVMSPADVEAHNANYVGGDINGGLQDYRQLFTRPVARLDPYSTPNPRIFICSSSTPPGGGVHGMSGYFAARSALRRRL